MYSKTYLRWGTNSKKASCVEIKKNLEPLKYRIYSLFIIIFILEHNFAFITAFDMLGKKESIFVSLRL